MAPKTKLTDDEAAYLQDALKSYQTSRGKEREAVVTRCAKHILNERDMDVDDTTYVELYASVSM